MKIAIVGLGAVGGFFAARLARSGADVSALVRGETFRAVKARGLTLIQQDGAAFTVPLKVSDQPAELGPQNLLILTVKTTGLLDVAGRLAPLIGANTRIFSAMNGIPWWFFDGLVGENPAAESARDVTASNARIAAQPLASIDPDGALRNALPASQVIGCVTHFACSTPEPGVVKQTIGERIIIGEPQGGDPARSPACAASIAAFSRAGFQVEASHCIQKDIWFKLWGNMTVNPVSALTGATGDRILDDPEVRGFMTRCMLEAAAIGGRIGLPISSAPEERHLVTRKLGAFRTSMLQDVEAGRPLELDALLASVIEIGHRVEVPRPNLQALMGLTRLAARSRGLYPQA